VKKLQFAATAALLATGCSTLSPAEDPVALRMTDIEARLIRIERVVENKSLVELSSEIERLRSETSALRGEIETLRFETENSDSRQRELYVDVDRRLQSLETGPRSFEPPPAVPPPFGAPAAAGSAVPSGGAGSLGAGASGAAAGAGAGAAAAARPAGSDQQNYQRAFDMISARRYEEAGVAFQTFLAQFPTSPLADNAQYWLAETRYVRGQFAEALPEFRAVIERYPQSAKLPDALLKVGYCQIELGDRNAARTSLQEVMRQFPDTTAARLASQRLSSLR
jgi:tol-pal system protein YbgF